MNEAHCPCVIRADRLGAVISEKYTQWNAAFDAGYAAALGKPNIVLQSREHDLALREMDVAANVDARTPEYAARALRYVTSAAS